MDFLFKNLEIIVAIVGGASIFSILFLKGSKTNNSNDLTPLYIKYKKHSDSINKSSKTIF